MGRPRTGTHAVPTVDRLLEAAELAFGRHGYATTRLEDIAREAGIRRSSLLYHFSTKRELHEAVVRRLFQSLMETLTAAAEQTASYEERIPALVDALFTFLDERPAFSPIVLRELIDGTGPGRALVLDQMVPALDRVEGWLRQAAGDRAPDDFDFRGAIVQIAMNAVVRASSGPLREPIWGSQSQSLSLVNRLLFLERTLD